MHLLQSDIEGISSWVIGQLKERNVDLNESARQVMIAKAIGHFIRSGRKPMEECITWEISLLPAVPKSNDRDIFVCLERELTLRTKGRLEQYLVAIGCKLAISKGRVSTTIPKSYVPATVRKRIKGILEGID